MQRRRGIAPHAIAFDEVRHVVREHLACREVGVRHAARLAIRFRQHVHRDAGRILVRHEQPRESRRRQRARDGKRDDELQMLSQKLYQFEKSHGRPLRIGYRLLCFIAEAVTTALPYSKSMCCSHRIRLSHPEHSAQQLNHHPRLKRHWDPRLHPLAASSPSSLGIP